MQTYRWADIVIVVVMVVVIVVVTVVVIAVVIVCRYVMLVSHGLPTPGPRLSHAELILYSLGLWLKRLSNQRPGRGHRSYDHRYIVAIDATWLLLECSPSSTTISKSPPISRISFAASSALFWSA